MSHAGPDLDQHFARVVDTLTEKFTGVHDRATGVRVVDDERAQLEGQARVVTYLPVMTTRRAIDRLAGRGLAYAS